MIDDWIRLEEALPLSFQSIKDDDRYGLCGESLQADYKTKNKISIIWVIWARVMNMTKEEEAWSELAWKITNDYYYAASFPIICAAAILLINITGLILGR